MMKFHSRYNNKVPLGPIVLIFSVFLVVQILFNPLSFVLHPLLTAAQGIQEAVEEVVDYTTVSKRSLWVENNLLRKQNAELRAKRLQYEQEIISNKERVIEESLFPSGVRLQRIAGIKYPFEDILMFESATEANRGDIVTLHGVYIGEVVRVTGSVLYAVQPKTDDMVAAFVPGIGEVQVGVLGDLSYQLILPLESTIPPVVFLARDPRIVLGEVVQTREDEAGNRLILSVVSPVNPAAFTEFSLIQTP